jgi:hypothetical protein
MLQAAMVEINGSQVVLNTGSIHRIGMLQGGTVTAKTVTAASSMPGGERVVIQSSRRKIGGVAHELDFLRREVAVAPGVELARASTRRHGA